MLLLFTADSSLLVLVFFLFRSPILRCCALGSPLPTQHCTLQTVHCFAPHSPLQPAQWTLCSALHCTLHTFHCTLHTAHKTLFCTTLHTAHCTLRTAHFPVHTLTCKRCAGLGLTGPPGLLCYKSSSVKPGEDRGTATTKGTNWIISMDTKIKLHKVLYALCFMLYALGKNAPLGDN